VLNRWLTSKRENPTRELVARVRPLHDRHASMEELLHALRAAGASPLASIAVLRELFGWPVRDAKRVL
jgi:hypothetical protein